MENIPINCCVIPEHPEFSEICEFHILCVQSGELKNDANSAPCLKTEPLLWWQQ